MTGIPSLLPEYVFRVVTGSRDTGHALRIFRAEAPLNSAPLVGVGLRSDPHNYRAEIIDGITTLYLTNPEYFEDLTYLVHNEYQKTLESVVKEQEAQ